jgi:hypothetical protein
VLSFFTPHTAIDAHVAVIDVKTCELCVKVDAQKTADPLCFDHAISKRSAWQ